MTTRLLPAKPYCVLIKLIEDEEGGEVLESAMVIGFIVLAAIGIMAKIGVKVLANWISIRDLI